MEERGGRSRVKSKISSSAIALSCDETGGCNYRQVESRAQIPPAWLSSLEEKSERPAVACGTRPVGPLLITRFARAQSQSYSTAVSMLLSCVHLISSSREYVSGTIQTRNQNNLSIRHLSSKPKSINLR